MLYLSPPPEVCGSFDPEKAEYIAGKLLTRHQKSHTFPASETKQKWQSIKSKVQYPGNVVHDRAMGILAEIDHTLAGNPAHVLGKRVLGAEVCIQNISDPKQRIATKWHIDYLEGTLGVTVGWTSFPPQIVVGVIDISTIRAKFSDKQWEAYHIDMMFDKFKPEFTASVEDALERESAYLFTPPEPGMILHMPNTTIHRSFVPNVAELPLVMPRMLVVNFLDESVQQPST